MNKKVYQVLKKVVPIIAIVNLIFVITFLASYSNYCDFRDLIKDIEKEQNDFRKMSPFTKVFCTYNEGDTFTRKLYNIYFILFNILQLASILIAFISYIAFIFNKGKCALISSIIFFLIPTVFELVDFIVSLNKDIKLSSNYFSHFSDNLIERINESLNDIKIKKGGLITYTILSMIFSIASGIISIMILRQFSREEMMTPKPIMYPNYQNQYFNQQNLIQNNNNNYNGNFITPAVQENMHQPDNNQLE